MPELETILSTPSSASGEVAWVSVAEAAERLGLDRSRVYTLVRSGELQGSIDPVAGLRVDAASVERRWALGGELAGSPLTPANAWLVIALASADPLFEARVVDLVRPAMLTRVRARLDQAGLRALAPRLRRRAVLRHLSVSPARAAELAGDVALVRTGPSAAAAYGWPGLDGLPLDAYVPPPLLTELLATPDLEASEPRATVWPRAERRLAFSAPARGGSVGAGRARPAGSSVRGRPAAGAQHTGRPGGAARGDAADGEP